MYLKLGSYRKQLSLLLASWPDNVSGITDPSDRSLTVVSETSVARKWRTTHYSQAGGHL